MAFDSSTAVELLRRSYRSGLLDELVAIADLALDGLVRETGLGVGDLIALLDAVPPEAVLRAEEAAASSDIEEVAAQLARAAADPEGAAERLKAYLAAGVERARAGTPLEGGCGR